MASSEFRFTADALKGRDGVSVLCAGLRPSSGAFASLAVAAPGRDF